MTITRRTAIAAGLSLPFARGGAAQAQAPSRSETLLLVQEYGPNSLDMQGIGSSQPVNGVALNCYDRLLRFKPVPIPGGGGNTIAMGELEGELAESWQLAPDGMSCTFKLRDATFHSGRKVTAKDVKWSLDRAVSIGGFATTQMNAGSLEKPEQFVVVDDKTLRIDFIRKDKMTLPNLAVTIPFVFDSELAIKNGGDDPWAKDYLKNNIAGSGAYKVESWKPGVETIYVRNDAWTCGKLPSLRRIIARDIASPSTRRALIERGDADISYGLPPKDFKDLADAGKVNVVGVPIPNGVWGCYLNTQVGPFKDVRLRQAVAWVMPYEKMLQASLFGRGVDMSGGPETPKVAWPQPFPYKTDVAKAKALVDAAGGGFSTTLLFDAGNATVAEPMSVLIKEALATIGINVEISKVPGANFRGEIQKKTNPMVLNRFAGWLDYPDYYLFWTMHGNNSIFNIAAYQNPALDKLVDEARFTADKATYDKSVVEFIKLVNVEVPMVPIAQPTHDVAMQKSIGGYQFQPCREPDFRYLTKG
ncbi:peptide/nickel transport system substrate-binding protein [Bosea sp. OK403]|uniref:ABC transporter substrate-binding protein n=1 Tax=Bosea sp. OK403 TaxID=1855286 RepID=UPI0008F0AB07|nr:ABC transporter substrate-binding protein [Bosea sp. OK403]SFI31270.1 peptide/nickel transport system substrate-binding protein [Bosea sp. OK403]